MVGQGDEGVGMTTSRQNVSVGEMRSDADNPRFSLIFENLLLPLSIMVCSTLNTGPPALSNPKSTIKANASALSPA